MGTPVWLTYAGMFKAKDPLALRDEISRQCESPAERKMASLIVETAFDLFEQPDGNYIIVTPQFDLSGTFGIPYRADFMVVTKGIALVIEVDGFAYHSGQQAFQRDRKRDRDFLSAGVPVVRFTALECSSPGAPDSPDSTYAALRRALRV